MFKDAVVGTVEAVNGVGDHVWAMALVASGLRWCVITYRIWG